MRNKGKGKKYMRQEMDGFAMWCSGMIGDGCEHLSIDWVHGFSHTL